MKINVYTEACVNLAIVLTKSGIPFEFKGDFQFGGGYFLFPDICKGDIACHWGTYGAEVGLFESYKTPWDGDDVSVMTAEEVIQNLQQVINKKD